MHSISVFLTLALFLGITAAAASLHSHASLRRPSTTIPRPEAASMSPVVNIHINSSEPTKFDAADVTAAYSPIRLNTDKQHLFGEEHIENEATSGVSGHVFTGEQTRTFTKRLQNTRMNPIHRTHICSKWAVVTTINAPTISIHNVVDQSNFCVVIVADIKTPTKEYLELESERIYFLSVEKQEKMQDMAITTELPWNHFGRKNLGYLYAIQHGADVIFDFDDERLHTHRRKVAVEICGSLKKVHGYISDSVQAQG